MTTPEKVMQAVKNLRNHLKLGQRKFGDLFGKTDQTIGRYETQIPPAGEMLADLILMAEKEGRPDIAADLREGLRYELGEKILHALQLPREEEFKKKKIAGR